MKTKPAIGALAAALWLLPAASGAQGILNRIEEGAGKAADAIGRGAGKVGQAAGKGIDKVGDSIDSTIDLATNEETPAHTRAKLDAMADQTLDRLLAENPAAAAMFETCAGYAVFDSRKVSVFPVSAGFGRGVAVSRPEGMRTYMNMGTGGVGAAIGIGGFETQFVIMFETPADFTGFVVNGYDATAETGAMYGDDRSDETLRFVDGRSFFVLGKKGWRVNANATGTKYWRAPDLN